MKPSETKKENKFSNWLKTSITARMLMVGILTILLLIPLSYIEDLIQERSTRQKEVINEINNKWGEEVLLYGPVLKIPYKTFQEKQITNQNTNKTYTETIKKIEYAYVFPDKLNIESIINPEQKAFGIYKTAVYQSNIQISGTFTKFDFKETDLKPEQILWDKIKVQLLTSNLKGVHNQVEISLNDNPYNFTSKYTKKNYSRNAITLHKLESNWIAEKNLPIKTEVPFTLQLQVKGSKQISFIPIGQETTTHINSHWKTANFFGEFLPYNPNKISDNGFDAKWKILDINRPFSQQHLSYLPDLKDFAYGVNFMIPVDEYQKSERTAKYGFLVISLTFLLFFLIQTISTIPIHPFQYLMIGLALTMFYTLLLSIAEHSSFFKAYFIAGTSVISLITLYAKTILKNVKFPMLIGAALTALYSFIFVIIQLENYALIVGSIGLFLILATVMFISRKIDWSNG